MKNLCHSIFDAKVKGSVIISAILALLYCYGEMAVFNQDFSLITAIEGIVFFFIYYLLIHIINYILHNNSHCLRDKYISKIEKHLFLYILVFLLIVWFPHLIVKYPTGSCYDTIYQIKQGLGYESLTSHHPVFHTMLMTWFYNFGDLLGNYNLGMFLFSVIEEIVLACIFSYSLSFIYKNKVSDIVIVISLLFCGFCPYVIGYIGQNIKDVYYSGFVVLFITMIGKYEIEKDDFWNKRINIVLLLLSSTLLSLFRNDGKFLVLLTLVVIAIIEIAKKNITRKLLVTFLLAILLSFVSVKTVDMIYSPRKGSKAEILSLPFQQTARFVKYHEDLVTKEEKEIIDKVLPYDELADLYDERLSDDVKDRFKNSTSKELFDYFGVWFKQFFKSPLTYLDATASQNVFLVFPRYNNFIYYVDCNDKLVEDQDYGVLQTPYLIKNIQDDYKGYLTMLHYSPFLYLINNMASFVIAFIIVVIIASQNRRFAMIFIPLIISILIAIAGPGICDHPRYVFPIIWSIPIWLGVSNIKLTSENL